MLNPQRLVVLRAVLAAGSVNRAAADLNYSPATISQHLAALARETRLVLFERRGRGIVPTDAARRLADESDALVADFGRLERVVADLRDGRAEHLAIACCASAAEQWIPAVVASVRRFRPGLTVEVTLNEPVDGRGRRQPDLDIRCEPAGGVEIHLDGYTRHELIVEAFVVVFGPGHRLAEAESVALRDLESETWIDHDIYDGPTGRIVAGACVAAGFTPRFAARLDDHRAALRLVAAGIGITVLPGLAVAGALGDLQTRPITEPAAARRIVVHARRDEQHGELIARAVSRLRKAAAG